jgi:transcriptional regulator with XRE-family HTH domain
MDKDPSTLLREIQQATGWSQNRLAVELKTSQPTVNRILKGQPKCLSDTLAAITELHERHCRGQPKRRRTDQVKD